MCTVLSLSQLIPGLLLTVTIFYATFEQFVTFIEIILDKERRAKGQCFFSRDLVTTAGNDAAAFYLFRLRVCNRFRYV